MVEVATLAAGCFWCTEAVVRRLKGVVSVTSGYTGGKRVNPSYEQVVSEGTGHAEAIQVEFDPSVLTYKKLLTVFWRTHDPTKLNQQDYDRGTQYRSAIFYHNKEQQRVAQGLKDALDQASVFSGPIVTEISPYTAFYKAEEYHQDFYERNRNQPYCTIIVDPKIRKLLDLFGGDVKEEFKHG